MIIVIIIIISIITFYKCCFDTVICQDFNLRHEAGEGLCASLYILDCDFSEYVIGACKYNFLDFL